MSKVAILATCNLNQWALDFKGNQQRILESITIAKQKGATYRVGPELEVCGYSCEDHFLEEDIFFLCWKSLAEILKSDATENILCDIGMPVMHRNVRYNCRVFCFNHKILLMRPKIFLADSGNYREPRFFTAWRKRWTLEEYYLPGIIRQVTGQSKVPFGEAALACNDTTIASETCEELFAPHSPHIDLGLSGIEIISNGSGSHHELRKLHTRIQLIHSATAKGGGVYLYANQQGCDGNRLYFDGCAMIGVNGKIVAQGTQFSVQDVEVVTAAVDLSDVRSYRGSLNSRGDQASNAVQIARIDVDLNIVPKTRYAPTPSMDVRYLSANEEIAYGPACWLWDYLRRSGMKGYFLPLSGGADSGATCALVGIMAQLVCAAVKSGNTTVLADMRRILDDDKYPGTDPKDFCKKMFYTCYMGTRNSSSETLDRARDIAEQVGAHHLAVTVDDIVDKYPVVFSQISKKEPKFKIHGGTHEENIALQNIQARSRMVLSYFLAQLLPWTQNRKGQLLVLGSANVDEALRGYYTKYDCSSADINPIGGICKSDLKKFLVWAADNRGFSALKAIVEAKPTAELEPVTSDYVQSDEVDMGMSYAELTEFGFLRKSERCGPIQMFQKLVHKWDHLTPVQVAEKVKRFFHYYGINRHKMTTLTPAYHAEGYGPDDNRFDLRQFLYPKWDVYFEEIDRLVQEYEKNPPQNPLKKAKSEIQ